MKNLEKRIVAAARGWVGTRFHHQGRLKRSARHKGGVDCLGLLIGVAQELDLRGRSGAALGDLDRRDYGHFPDGLALRAALEGALVPVGEITPGCILLLAPDGVARHLGIAGDAPDGGLTLIHAYAQARAVVEHGLDAGWRERVRGIYNAWA